MPNHSKPDQAGAPRLLIAGFGDLGQRLQSLVSSDWQVVGLRRSNAPDENVISVQADLNQCQSLEPVRGDWDAVIYTATPAERTPDAYRSTYVDGLSNLLATVRARRLIFVSSTAVFGQQQGDWVDETSSTEPVQFNGQILLEAERLTVQAGGLVVRFSGIYGPGRNRLLERVRAGKVRCQRTPPRWTNRIHADDCAAVLAHLIRMDDPASLYLASDHKPAPRWDVLSWLARQLDVQGPVEIADSSDHQGKRVDNRRLIDSGFTFRYPDYRSGYSSLLDSSRPGI